MININKNNVVLELPSIKSFNSYIEALEEGYYIGIQPPKTKDEIQKIVANPESYLESLNDQTPGTFEAPSGEVFEKVPYEKLWITADNIFIGEISFRHKLNKFLEDFGGHVGYGIRPSLSGKGFATLSVELLKKRAASIGMESLLITCSPCNPASKRIIEKCGGEFIDISPDTHGYKEICYRYVIKT